jgi:predicted metal-dependent phosphoesterase TrpH
MTTNRHNILHKRQQYNLNQLKKILKNNNLTTVKADKTKAIVTIDNKKLKMKVNNFITENQMQLLNKDPTETYQKQIHQTIQKCNTLIDKHIHKYLTNIKPLAPQLNVYIKTHKENQPIRPVINNTQAPSYKAARYINKKLQNLIKLPYTYNTQNSQEIAQELTKLQINENMRIITRDIKDMYVNLPIKGIIKTV